MKTTRAYMRKILRTLQKMQFNDNFGRDFQVRAYSSDKVTAVEATFIYHATNRTDEKKWDVFTFTFYDFWEKETNDSVLTKIQNHINEHQATN